MLDWSKETAMQMCDLICDFLWNSGLAAKWGLFRRTSGLLNKIAMRIYMGRRVIAGRCRLI